MILTLSQLASFIVEKQLNLLIEFYEKLRTLFSVLSVFCRFLSNSAVHLEISSTDVGTL